MDLCAIIFDFDGVLAESVNVKTCAFAALYEKYGPEIQRAVVDFHLRNGGMSRYEKFRFYHMELLGKPLSAEEEKALGAHFSKLVLEKVINAPMVPGGRRFLERHRHDCDMHVASGTPDDEIKLIVRERGLSRFFVTVSGSPRTKTEIIKSILSEYDYPPGKVVMVGDALSDYAGATESGVRFIGRVGDEEDNPFPPTEITIRDLRELETAIQQLFN